MNPKTTLTGFACTAFLMAGSFFSDTIQAAPVSAQDLTWYQTNPFSGGTAWDYGTDSSFISPSNPSGGVLGSYDPSSVDTSVIASFPTQTLWEGGDAVSLTIYARRTNVVSDDSSFLSISLGYDGGTPMTQDYFSPNEVPDDNWITEFSYFNNRIYFPDTSVQKITIQISRWAPAPEYFRRQIWINDVEIPVAGDGFFGADKFPTAEFNQVIIGWNWGSASGPNLIGVVAVPEPSTYGLMACAGALAVCVYRSRKKALRV